MKRYGLTEFELEESGFKIRLRRDAHVENGGKSGGPPQFVVETPLGLGTGVTAAPIIPMAAPMPTNTSPPFPHPPTSATPTAPIVDEPGIQIIKSPMVGTFYRSPNPDAKVFVEEGTVVQTKGFRMMNIMFDQLDRLNQRYTLRATVETEGEDLNPTDNVATKSFNVDGRALPGSVTTYRYRLANSTDAQLTGSVHIDHTAIPSEWIMTADPQPGTMVTLAPREVFTGYVTVKTPKRLADGQYIDLQAGLVGANSGKIYLIDQDEWYFVATTQPPQVDKPTVTVRPDGGVAVNVAAFDPICGIKEASGVQVAYSLDHGTTFSTRVMAYTRGNFYDKTWFEGVLGPFATGVEVATVVTVANNAGIVRRFDLAPVKIGAEASGNAGQPLH